MVIYTARLQYSSNKFHKDIKWLLQYTRIEEPTEITIHIPAMGNKPQTFCYAADITKWELKWHEGENIFLDIGWISLFLKTDHWLSVQEW